MMPAAKILVVDDDLGLLQLMRDMLVRQGYQVLVAESGPLALDLALREHPDLILLDVMMPEMDGFEVCRRLRQDPRTADILITFVTAKGKLQDKEVGFGAGGDDYLVKPFSMRELVLRVNATLERAGRIREQVEAEQEQRIVEEKRNAVIELAGATSHELNQLLFAIRAYVLVVSEQVDKAKLQADLDKLEEALAAMGAIIHKLGHVQAYETKEYQDDVRILDLDRSAGGEP
ncbi:MAG: response regulator [Chloroflexi bacterium]|nr:response regulator [Chloroflexota bacterium]